MQRIPTKNSDVDILIIKDEKTGNTFAFRLYDFSGNEYINPDGINLDTMEKTVLTYDMRRENKIEKDLTPPKVFPTDKFKS